MSIIPVWRSPDGTLAAAQPGELHLWLIDTDMPSSAGLGCLSSDERERARKMLAQTAAQRFCAARIGLRRIIAGYLGVDAASIRFIYGKHGKPELAYPFARLQFNLTHSGRLALLALTDTDEIGVDIEPLDSRPALMAIAGKLFGEETQKSLEMLEASQRTQCFFQLWTLREARAKCIGNSVFSQPDMRISALNFTPEAGWVAAVAMTRTIPEPSTWCSYRLAPLV